MKTKNQILSFILVSVFLLFGTGCAVIQPHHSGSKISHSSSRGKTFKGHSKKYSGENSATQFAPGKVKKHKKHK